MVICVFVSFIIIAKINQGHRMGERPGFGFRPTWVPVLVLHLLVTSLSLDFFICKTGIVAGKGIMS